MAPEETAILVPNSRLALFADISPFNLSQTCPVTKSGDDMIPLESLLDRKKSVSDPFENLTFTEVPFHDDGAFVKLGSEKDGSDARSTSVKKFLVIRTSETTCMEYVATMLPDALYAEEHPDFTFLARPDFTGIIIYSKLDGDVLEVRKYLCGKILQAQFLSEEEIDGPAEEKTFIFFPASSDYRTKVVQEEEDILDPSYCIAEKNKDNKDKNNGQGDTGPREPDTRPGGGGGGGSVGSSTGDGNGNGSDSNKGPDNQQPDFDAVAQMEEEYSVILSCNAPDAVTLLGDGRYQKGQTVHISYNYTVPFDIQFKYWAGDFSDKSGAEFSFIIEKSMQSHAFFEWGEKPCMKQNHTGNPLISMSVAPSGIGWDNWIGGTFGWTRTEKNEDDKLIPKKHSGLDLAASVGTSVFSMYDGVVISSFTTARDGKLGKDDNRKLGNDIRIQTTLPDGQTITVVFAHLQYGEPIATNPRTGNPFQTGDQVYAGELVAYSGITGNAWNVRHPHVHLGVKLDGAWVDPANYINGSYSTTNLKSNKGKIAIVDCY